jgi:hypothetical protein
LWFPLLGLGDRVAALGGDPFSSRRHRIRLGSPVVGSINITFEMWIGSSKLAMPPS